ITTTWRDWTRRNFGQRSRDRRESSKTSSAGESITLHTLMGGARTQAHASLPRLGTLAFVPRPPCGLATCSPTTPGSCTACREFPQPASLTRSSTSEHRTAGWFRPLPTASSGWWETEAVLAMLENWRQARRRFALEMQGKPGYWSLSPVTLSLWRGFAELLP